MSRALSDLFQEFLDACNDATNDRWQAPEFIRFVNDGQLAVSIARPDLCVVDTTLTTTSGARQTLPSDAVKLLRITSNGTTGKEITMVKREILSASLPGWRASPQSATTKHVMYDETDPLHYDCWPPSDGTATHAAIYASKPALIATPGGNTIASITGNIGIKDEGYLALLHYTLGRAFGKDSEADGNDRKSQEHYQLYAALLGLDVKSKKTYSPNQNSPLVPGIPLPTTKPLE